jgi:hypothetical protein
MAREGVLHGPLVAVSGRDSAAQEVAANQRGAARSPSRSARPSNRGGDPGRAARRESTGFTPINKLSVQAPLGSKSRYGPLSWFVRGRDLRALQAYLLIIGVNASGHGEPGGR